MKIYFLIGRLQTHLKLLACLVQRLVRLFVIDLQIEGTVALVFLSERELGVVEVPSRLGHSHTDEGSNMEFKKADGYSLILFTVR